MTRTRIRRRARLLRQVGSCGARLDSALREPDPRIEEEAVLRVMLLMTAMGIVASTDPQ